MNLTFLDFFAGVGGFRRGMELAGHKCLGHCEIDKFANMSYNAIHDPKGDEWFESDIRRANADELPRADVWCFGFPCQDISVAGKQLGFKGQRSSLFFTVTRLVRDTKEENRPKYLFIENVKNLLSVNGGTDFLKLQIELDEIGYDCEWQVLNSKDFGVPQNRERVFIIGHLRGRSTRKIFPIQRCSNKINIQQIGNIDSRENYDNPQTGRIFSIDGISPALTTMQGGRREPKVLIKDNNNKLDSVNLVGNVNPSGNGMNGQVYDSDGISPTLTTNKGEGPKVLVRAVLSPDRVNTRQNGRRIKENEEPMFTLTTQDRHGIAIKEATKKGYSIAEEGDSINIEQPNSKTRRGRVGKKIANTLTTSCNQGTPKYDLEGYRIRKLTPKECWRLQAWRDEDFEKAAALCSNSQLYKQAGNGVTVSVIYEIAKKL